MLSYGQTRWLSLENWVNRVLEQWLAMQFYFTNYVTNSKDPVTYKRVHSSGTAD